MSDTTPSSRAFDHPRLYRGERPQALAISSALLSEVAKDLDDVLSPPVDTSNDMERALLKHNSTLRENSDLLAKVASLTSQLAAANNGNAQEVLRLSDQVAMLKGQNASLQEQRDLFANYAIEVRTRNESLLTVMSANAKTVETMIMSTIDAVEQDMSTRIGNLSLMMLSNAQTARTLIDEALATAKNDTIVQLNAKRVPAA